MSVSRRRLMRSGAGLLGLAGPVGLFTRAAAGAAGRQVAISIGDVPGGAQQGADKITRRFAIYKSLGIRTLRVAMRWSDLELRQGAWGEPPNLAYLRLARDQGFRFRMLVSTLGSPPDWFRQQHPEALIRNASGETTKNDLSPWYPGLGSLLQSANHKMLALIKDWGLDGSIEALLVDLGPSGEPLYPPAWVMGPGHSRADATFWFFDRNAEASFRAAMTRRYGGIAGAGAKWGAAVQDLNGVRPADFARMNGAFKKDVLEWYRDSKRDLIRVQADNLNQAVKAQFRGAVPTFLLLPGKHLDATAIDRAASSSSDTYDLEIMPDTNFLIDLASRSGHGLQFTALEEEPELSYIRRTIDATGARVPLWGENAAGQPAHRPVRLAGLALSYGLQGLEFVNAGAIFEADGVTPNDNFRQFETACRQLAG